MSEAIRISIGTEPMQLIPCEVLKSSIIRRTSWPVEFTESWNPEQGWHPVLEGMPEIKRGTKFSTWRWCVPAVYGVGNAIYLDADQACLTDISELWETPLRGAKFAAVKNAVGIFGAKKKPEPGAVQTSVMLMDCDYCYKSVSMVYECADGNMGYKQLMQAKWMDPEVIRELDPGWNHFGIHNDQTKILHWSHVKSQPYRNPDHPTAHIFEQELRAAIVSGHISPKLLREEVTKKHLHRNWLRVLD